MKYNINNNMTLNVYVNRQRLLRLSIIYVIFIVLKYFYNYIVSNLTFSGFWLSLITR